MRKMIFSSDLSGGFRPLLTMDQTVEVLSGGVEHLSGLFVNLGN